jgi:hypothetical protein
MLLFTLFSKYCEIEEILISNVLGPTVSGSGYSFPVYYRINEDPLDFNSSIGYPLVSNDGIQPTSSPYITVRARVSLNYLSSFLEILPLHIMRFQHTPKKV